MRHRLVDTLVSPLHCLALSTPLALSLLSLLHSHTLTFTLTITLSPSLSFSHTDTYPLSHSNSSLPLHPSAAPLPPPFHTHTPASRALLAAQLGIIVFNIGLTQGLARLGALVGVREEGVGGGPGV